MNQQDRYIKIMDFMQGQSDFVTTSQICRATLGQYTTSDVGVTGQILNVLNLAGLVEKKQVLRGRKAFYVVYRLTKSSNGIR